MNSSNTTSNLDTLIAAGIIPAEEKSKISTPNVEIIESMTRLEVVSVIAIHDRLGKEFFEDMISHAAFF
jgi:hypothetical protein